MDCEPKGEPTPLVIWQRNGVRVETGDRFIVDESVLKIIDARSSDSGIYICVAKNEAGADQQAFTLEILSKFLINLLKIKFFLLKFIFKLLQKLFHF